MPFLWTVIMRFVQWSLSGCKSCEVVFLFINCGKHSLRRMRCHVKKKHARHDCTWLVHCAIMTWTDEQGSHEIHRIIVKAVFKQHLLRTTVTSALSSCRIVSVVCLHSSALIHNCWCQCVLCVITTGSRGAFVCRYSVFFLAEGTGTHDINIKTTLVVSAHLKLYMGGLMKRFLVLS